MTRGSGSYQPWPVAHLSELEERTASGGLEEKGVAVRSDGAIVDAQEIAERITAYSKRRGIRRAPRTAHGSSKERAAGCCCSIPANAARPRRWKTSSVMAAPWRAHRRDLANRRGNGGLKAAAPLCRRIRVSASAW